MVLSGSGISLGHVSDNSRSLRWLGTELEFTNPFLPHLRLEAGGEAGMVLPSSPSPSLSLQDEVAHTVTESRVLQNTRHPFLTVSNTLSQAGRTRGASRPPLGQSSDPSLCGAWAGVGLVVGVRLYGLPRWPELRHQGGSPSAV